MPEFGATITIGAERPEAAAWPTVATKLRQPSA